MSTDDHDDSDAYVRTTNGYVGDAETLLQMAIDRIAQAPSMPLSSSAPRFSSETERYDRWIKHREQALTQSFLSSHGS